MSDIPSDFDQLIRSITPEIYRNLKQAIELGKWPDGRKLTAEQKENTFQAIIAYEHQNIAEENRTGYIDRGSKDDGEVCGEEEFQPLNIRN